MGEGGGRHLPQSGSGSGLLPPEIFEILDANSCFLVHSARKCKIPHVSIPGCITCSQHRVTLKTGQLASRPGLRRDARQSGEKTGHPSKNGTGGNPTTTQSHQVQRPNTRLPSYRASGSGLVFGPPCMSLTLLSGDINRQ